MTTLTPHVLQYLTERQRRGEISAISVVGYRSTLMSLDQSFGKRPLDQLGTRAIERWLETRGHLSPATRRGNLSTARGFCAWMTERGRVASDPCDKVKRVRQPRSVPRAISHEDVARLLHATPDLRGRVIVMLMVGCGLRCVEVSRLGVTDYNPVARVLFITGKGGNERELPMPAEVARVVDQYLTTTGIIAGSLIRSARGGGLSAQTISTYVSRWMAAAGLKTGRWDGRSAHALRHTCASDVLDGGAQITVVQAMLGHQALSSTSIYLRRANLGQMRTAMEGRSYYLAA